MTVLRVATTNAGKLRELRDMLAPLGYRVLGLDDIHGFAVVEDGATFAENALKKAQALAALTRDAAVADDSGLEVDALQGAPGIYSARYAGVEGPDQDAANRRKLLAAMTDVSDHERTARFVCAIAYVAPDRPAVVYEGRVEGQITREERGSGGFGYDSLFLVPSLGQTTAELSAEAKHAISHRGQAVRALMRHLAAASVGRGSGVRR